MFGYSSICFPFGLLTVPVMLPEVVVGFEHWIHFHVQCCEYGQQAKVIVALPHGVVLERDAISRPILKADGLNAGEAVEGATFEVYH